MLQKFLIPVFCMILFTVSCKKDSGSATKTSSTSTGIEFSASAATALNLTIDVSRPVTATTGTELVYFTQNGLVNPYSYKYDQLKSGDKINIVVWTTKNQPITGTLKVNGTVYDTNYSSLTDEGQSTVGWNVVVP